MKYSYPRSLHGTSITVNPSYLDSRDRLVGCSFILFSHDRDFRDRDIKCEWQQTTEIDEVSLIFGCFLVGLCSRIDCIDARGFRGKNIT